MIREILQLIVLHAFMLWIAIARIRDGRKILQTEIYTFSKKVDPTNSFSEYEKITYRGNTAKLMGYEAIVIGITFLVLPLVNLIFRIVDTKILFAMLFFGMVISGVSVSSRSYNMYLRARNNNSL